MPQKEIASVVLILLILQCFFFASSSYCGFSFSRPSLILIDNATSSSSVCNSNYRRRCAIPKKRMKSCCHGTNLSEDKDEDDCHWHNNCWKSSRREFLSWGSVATATAAVLGIQQEDSLAVDTAKEEKEQQQQQQDSRVVPKSSSTSFDAQIPFSSVRRIKTVTLSNGLRVLLVSDKRAVRASAALSVQGAGQFADPNDLPGLAHLAEHMLLCYNSKSKFRQSRDFEDWLGDQEEGASNGFTAYDMVCFHFFCMNDVFAEALDRFAGLFLEQDVEQICRDADALRREVRRVDAELDVNDETKQSYYLLKSFVTPEHPYARFSAGNLETLERIPKKANIDVASRLIRFFREHYLPNNSLLVVVGPQELFVLERFVAPFALSLARVKTESVGTNKDRRPQFYPGGFLQGNRLKHMVLYRNTNKQDDRDEEKLYFQWALNLDYSEQSVSGNGRACITARHIGFILAQILGRRGPGSLYLFLQRRGWSPGGSTGVPRFHLPLDVSGFQIITFELLLTLEGWDNRKAIVAAVYDIINSVQGRDTLTRELISQYATMAKLHGYVLAPRPSDAVELAVDGQFYGISGPNGVASGRFYRFPEDRNSVDQLKQATSSALSALSDTENVVIIATAGSKALSTSRLFDEPLPPLSSPKWLTEPVTGARFYFEDMFQLSARLEELVLSKVVDAEELQRPALNPLVPTTLRPQKETRSVNPFYLPSNEEVIYRTATEGGSVLLRTSATGGDTAGDWVVLNGGSPYQEGLPLPRGPPEPNCMCAFVLQLLSSRPARADVRQAARSELWKLSFESSISDLAEFGAAAGLAYDLSFNKFGLRLSFFGSSQTLPSYARRLCRRLVNHHFRLLDGPETLPTSLTNFAIASAIRARAAGQQQLRRRRIISNLRASTAFEAAIEGVAFLRSCGGAVCFAQGDLLPTQMEALLNDLEEIFRVATGGASARTPAATPTIKDLVYPASWKPRSGSSCSLPGVALISDACGRTSR